MDQARCPYCVEGNDFKIMSPQGDHLVCLKCGHTANPRDPKFKCICLKCHYLNKFLPR